MPAVLTTPLSRHVNDKIVINGEHVSVKLIISLNINNHNTPYRPLLVAGMRIYYRGYSRWSGWTGTWAMKRSPVSGRNFVTIEIEVPGGEIRWLHYQWSRFGPYTTLISQRQLGDSRESDSASQDNQRQLGDGDSQSDGLRSEAEVDAWTVVGTTDSSSCFD